MQSKTRRKCDFCGREYLARNSALKTGLGRLCSRSCVGKSTMAKHPWTGSRNPKYVDGLWEKRKYTYKKRFRDKYPEKAFAHDTLRKAIRSGKIHKPGACEDCGKKCITHGHHVDYDKPLDVVWLCRACHLSKHTKAKKQ